MDYFENVSFKRELPDATVLIADPFVERSMLLASRLSALGYEVVRCSTFAAAKSACLETRPLTCLPNCRSRMAPVWISSV